MNPGIASLYPYPFEKLGGLIAGLQVSTGKSPIDLSIGEPKHKTPAFILEELAAHLSQAATYPKTHGSRILRESIAAWLCKRFRLPEKYIHPDKHILPVNGTREALFAIAQCMVDRTAVNATIVLPNPFYQIYEGAALLAGARPYYLNCTDETNFIPDFASVPAEVWRDCQLVYICSPGNPTGSIITQDSLTQLLELADQHDFIVAADECYSEIYFDEGAPPLGLLQAAAHLGRDDFSRCLVFHSLSKRSNVPGMRSGFVAGDEKLIHTFLRYRTYHGCAMPGYTQAASVSAWQDETHVQSNRELYRRKFASVLDILNPVLEVRMPEAGFYLWPAVPVDDTEFTKGLYARQNVTVLPGSYLSRTINNINPGESRLRIALVASLDECIDAAERIRDYINSL